MSEKVRSFWGWGYESQAISAVRRENLKAMIGAQLGPVDTAEIAPPTLDEIELRPPRLGAPSSLAPILDASPRERAAHSYGKSFRDVCRALARDYPNPPDLVAFPRSEDDLVRVLGWCDEERIAAVPYGGGSSVTGGVEPPAGADRGVVTIDLKHLGKVLEVDTVSRAARIQAGVYGPALEDQLRPRGLTLRHFPQSFEFSSLGGWIATRAGGHFATLHTHIDDFVESVRAVTPAGLLESRRLPASGAGPDPYGLLLGSEGSLGIITEAWMRLQSAPRFRASATVKFAGYDKAVSCVREIAQSDLYPSNCRLLDAAEAMVSGTNLGKDAVLLLAFESAAHSPQARMEQALDVCRAHEGRVPEGSGRAEEKGEGARAGAAGAWRRTFLEGPYLRDALLLLGLVVETFETAVTWEKFGAFHAGVVGAAQEAIERVCGRGIVTCRFTHVYPDGVAPYYTVLAAGKNGDRLSQWSEIKAAASEAILKYGGTITHHHAVGRDHRPWYDRERPDLFARAFGAAKGALDPHGIMNPGVLVDG